MKEFKICGHHCDVDSRNTPGGSSKIGSGTKPHCCRWIRAGPLSHGIGRWRGWSHPVQDPDLAHTHHH